MLAGALGSNLGWWYQKPLPYRLATPQSIFDIPQKKKFK